MQKGSPDFFQLDGPLANNTMRDAIYRNILSFQGRDPETVGNLDCYKALAYALRHILVEKWIATQKGYYARGKKRVYYLSLEFLIGRSLGNCLINLGVEKEVGKVVAQMGYEIEELREAEEEAALGNGGLGRLAACFLDSMATLNIPAYGYGIRYEFGLFHQRFQDGYQVESPDNWLRLGNPWEIERVHHLYPVHFYGRIQESIDENGRFRTEWVDTDVVMAMPCDVLVPGYKNNHVINMRLWTAKASRELDLNFFNRGEYIAAVENKARSETISKVLYPTDHMKEGRELRLKQQYFFVAATFQDIFRRYKKRNRDFSSFSQEVAVQLNDTHPAIAIPELMRLFLDEEGLDWEEAWEICVATFAYTNHTLMPEALETWPVDLLAKVLPRHLQIIYEINRRLLEEVARRYPGKVEKLRNMSMIEEGPVKKVRMAHLAIAGSHSVNGVARLHTHLLKNKLFRDFAEFYPGRINNKTNGITQRRWLLKSNPDLAGIISAHIGNAWVADLYQLKGLEAWAMDSNFQRQWQQVKRGNKERLAALIKEKCDVSVDPLSLFDVQVKRIHEYKRQMLNMLHVITLYHRTINDSRQTIPPRTVIFAGKAAPSYWLAKLIIKFINSVAAVINNDPRVRDMLKVVFIPNYSVTLAEKIIPAADLSEQISTAGTEASGTGNMKLALNGALTIGTLDGANIEIMEEVGRENMFIFGLTVPDAEGMKGSGKDLRSFYYADPELKNVIDGIARGEFSGGDRDLFRPLVDALLAPHDPFLHLADYGPYVRCQEWVELVFQDQKNWTRKSILNVARMGKFSSDRTIREYARDIWNIYVE